MSMTKIIRSMPLLRRLDDYTNTKRGFWVGFLAGVILWYIVLAIIMVTVERHYTVLIPADKPPTKGVYP